MLWENFTHTLPYHTDTKARYDKWATFLETQVVFALADSAFHTQSHCARVLLYALLMGDSFALTDCDKDALGAAAVFHDTRRQNDYHDTGHGKRAAEYYRQFCQESTLAFDERTYWIMTYHDRDDTLGETAIKKCDPTCGILLYHIFKDADGLDRLRFGEQALDERMLRTMAAQKLLPAVRTYFLRR